MTKRQTVYVVLYGHKHGEDCWVTSSEKRAEASIGGIILEYIGDLQDAKVARKIKKLIKDGKYLKAAGLWFQHMEEWFEINPRTVDT